ncbi:MAG: ACP S-malonyltransferase [Bacillota bacterium]
MSKIAFIFPGQGSQRVGMGEDLAQEYQIVEDTFTEANQVVDIDVKELCFSGPEDKLTETANTQPAILTTSIAFYRLLKEEGLAPDMVAGHSLGEYAALVAAEVLDFKTALKLVRKRGQLMSQADPEGQGTMAAVIGLEASEVEKVCDKGSQYGVVEAANYNCPGQIVISGEKEAVEQTTELAQEAGAKKAVVLNVSGPFHSSLMEGAGEKLADYLDQLDFKDAQIPIVTNVTAEATTDAAEIKNALIKQISGAVKWEESIKTMIASGVDTFVEVGPNRVLKGFMRRIDRSVNALNVRNLRSLNKTKKKL